VPQRRLISFANRGGITERQQWQQNCQQTALKKFAKVVKGFA